MHVLTTGESVSDPLAPYVAVERRPGRLGCWVMGHMVGGLDGSAAIGGRVGQLSTAPDAELFRLMRVLADVVLVGAQTVRAEGYGPVTLPPERVAARRAAGKSDTPAIAIVSRSLDLDWSAKMFTHTPADRRTMVVTCQSADPDRLAAARGAAEVVLAGTDRVEPAAALAGLAQLGHRVVVCEGGPTWLGELVAADLLDELCLTISPVMGGDPLPVSVTPAGAPVTPFALRHVLADGDTLFLRYERGPR
ncbi:pyrimidine reductase family protein [Cryptosporangium aurantiacum]|uniref:Pyrimidine reductase, riboflavin biosynthesis n=1 Tax=Cryptosporangium aurantiacum TaxID=134849 RepID=A0A1M7PBW8_9ACTN|nr:pyrimidine reductase family protein [Cryptosporangium aurantiacum]SHN14335.1 Pyrimidine reductase, riboflavin biosynthesis [Cryptosporangium aurantiacum]